MNSCPNRDATTIIDVESSKPGNNLKMWPEWVEFVKSWSRSYQFQKGFKPTPLTANLVAETPPTEAESEAQESMKYSTEQWIAWLQEDEGKYHVAQGFPLPPEGKNALHSVVQKGKGKGKSYQGGDWQSVKGGWQTKGKGKGYGFQPYQASKGALKGKGKGRSQYRLFL